MAVVITKRRRGVRFRALKRAFWWILEMALLWIMEKAKNPQDWPNPPDPPPVSATGSQYITNSSVSKPIDRMIAISACFNSFIEALQQLHNKSCSFSNTEYAFAKCSKLSRFPTNQGGYPEVGIESVCIRCLEMEFSCQTLKQTNKLRVQSAVQPYLAAKFLPSFVDFSKRTLSNHL